MDKETTSKVFDPFYTTKDTGKGTGLGISTVYGIVKQSGDYISVYSQKKQGTTFKIYLPHTNDEPDIQDVPLGEKRLRKGDEQILVVEDEGALRGLFNAILTKLGYQVTLAANGSEALLLVEKSGLKLDLVITDVIMPGMDVNELVKCLQRNRPGLKVLYMSGYTDEAIVNRGAIDPSTPFIQKPFNIRDIVAKIEQILQEGQDHPDDHQRPH